MKVPKLFCGTGKEVHAKAKRYFARAQKLGSFPEFSADEMLDSKDFPTDCGKPAVVFEMQYDTGGPWHYRAYCAGQYNDIRTGEQLFSDTNMLFDGLVKHDWGLLMLVGYSAVVPVPERDLERNHHFFERLLEAWPVFLAERHLFYSERMIFYGGPYFWNNAGHSLWPLMVDSGVPKGLFKLQFPTERMRDDWVPETIKTYILK